MRPEAPAPALRGARTSAYTYAMFFAVQPGFSRFTYLLQDAERQPVGKLVWPDLALAMNSRLKGFVPEGLSQTVALEYLGRALTIEFEILGRSFGGNDYRFDLKEAGQVRASATVTQVPGWFQRPRIRITQPWPGDVLCARSLFSIRYEVTQEDRPLGAVFEPFGFRLKREWTLEFPETVEPATQFFLFFLVCNHAIR